MSRRLPLYGEGVVANDLSVSIHEPKDAGIHLFDSSYGRHAFVVNGSQVFDVVSTEVAPTSLEAFMAETLGAQNQFACTVPSDVPAIRSISLNIAQGCNLSCVYCYADSGK